MWCAPAKAFFAPETCHCNRLLVKHWVGEGVFRLLDDQKTADRVYVPSPFPVYIPSNGQRTIWTINQGLRHDNLSTQEPAFSAGICAETAVQNQRAIASVAHDF